MSNANTFPRGKEECCDLRRVKLVKPGQVGRKAPRRPCGRRWTVGMRRGDVRSGTWGNGGSKGHAHSPRVSL